MLVKTDTPDHFTIEDHPELRAVFCKSRKRLEAVVGQPMTGLHSAPQWVLLKDEKVFQTFGLREELKDALRRFGTCEECGSEWEKLDNAWLRGDKRRRVCGDCSSEMRALKEGYQRGRHAADDAARNFDHIRKEAEELWACIKLLREATGVGDVHAFLAEREEKSEGFVPQEFVEAMHRHHPDWPVMAVGRRRGLSRFWSQFDMMGLPRDRPPFGRGFG